MCASRSRPNFCRRGQTSPGGGEVVKGKRMEGVLPVNFPTMFQQMQLAKVDSE